MDIGAILVGIALLTLSGAYVARPLFAGLPASPSPEALDPRAVLVARRDAIYALIRELDDDHLTGKVNDQDYQLQRKHLVAQGVAVLKQLDDLGGEDREAALEAEIEAAVLALRKPAAHRKGARFCTQCGQPVTPEDNFCAHCGHPLKETAAP